MQRDVPPKITRRFSKTGNNIRIFLEQRTSFELGNVKCIVFDDSDHEIRSNYEIIRIKKFDLRGNSFMKKITRSGELNPLMR